uniref:Sugar phosphate transporter domain-containing protein n=1 Tax=Trieres chinensis TaxID=1514140 RepID=A0A6U1TA57_TRICV|mmetsp:Transcript_1447/g.3097  ORF Transcript_1447/g.3097 Transcript_1447/m.3097 type:complete len:423 (+) Transcript_1447:61-1329(+)
MAPMMATPSRTTPLAEALKAADDARINGKEGWVENEPLLGGSGVASPSCASPSGASSVASGMSASSASASPRGTFESLPRPTQLAALSLGVFVFFGVHNVLQEAMTKVEGFEYGVMLGWMEVLGVAVCSYVERKFVAKESGRVAPLSAYPPLTICLLASTSLSALSLDYINFPTKVVFRSCKLVPTMLISTMVNRTVFSASEYGAALAVCAGLALFASADFVVAGPSFHPLGLALVTASVCADAVLPNAQERLFRLGSSRLEVTFYVNLFTLMVQTASTYLSGDMMGLFHLAAKERYLAVYMVVYTLIAYIAVSLHMTVVKRFGGVAAVFVGTGRKGMTLILSFLLFPKDFSWRYPAGAILVLGGLAASSVTKLRKKRRKVVTPPTSECEGEDSDAPQSGNSAFLVQTNRKDMEMGRTSGQR